MQPQSTESLTFSDSLHKEIVRELDLVLKSDLFCRSSVLSRFLRYIVEETLNGNTEGLKEYTIAVCALGKPSDFNPQIDAIVRIHAGRLRRLLNEYYSGPGISDPARIELVKGTYVPVFRIQQLSENVSELNEDNASPNAPQYSRSKLTLAVLPFRNLCPDNDYQFFVDGFGEELTNIFSSFQEISVVAHHSTLKYSSIHDDIRVIGTDLGAHYLINGSVKRSSKEIKVNVGLIETLKGMQIWSKSYSHQLEVEKIIDIQDQINHDVFAILSGQYGFIIRNKASSLQNPTRKSLASFDAILWNYHAHLTHSEEACFKCRKELEKALEIDDENVMCLVMLGDLYLYSYSLGYQTVEDPVKEAYKLIKKAIRIAPQSQYVHLIHGGVNIYLNRKEEAIEALEYSIQLGTSSASFNGTLGFGFACVGDYDRASVLLRQSLELNPYCPWWYYMAFFFISFQNANYKEALVYAEKICASEDVYLEPLLKAAAKGELGLISEAKNEVKTLSKKFPHILHELKISLNTFLLDIQLIDGIIRGAKKAGVPIA